MGKTAPLILRPDETRVYDMRLGEARILVDGKRSGGAWWLGQFREDPGFTTLLHVHQQRDEEFFVLEGVMSVYVEARWHDLEAGALAIVPRGTPHAQANSSRQPARFLAGGNPAGFEGFFPAQHHLLRRLAPSDPQFQAEIEKLVGQYDTENLGPPPPRA